tara:strand:+ start:1547 stop:1921 length:375 start_codon:yes stop_codon:yes gene_type:complete
MPHLKVAFQILLFLTFAIGGTYRLLQPIEALASKMLWVSYFDPRIVRSIAFVEVLCGVGLIIPFIFKDLPFDIIFYAGSLLMLIMLGAAVTHLLIGDYKQIFGNVILLVVAFLVIFSSNQSLEG